MKPHTALKYIHPDEVAECWDGVLSAGLYESLWEKVDLYDRAHEENIEDMGPHDVIGLNSVSKFWSKFSMEEQTLLNSLAKRNER